MVKLTKLQPPDRPAAVAEGLEVPRFYRHKAGAACGKQASPRSPASEQAWDLLRKAPAKSVPRPPSTYTPMTDSPSLHVATEASTQATPQCSSQRRSGARTPEQRCSVSRQTTGRALEGERRPLTAKFDPPTWSARGTRDSWSRPRTGNILPTSGECLSFGNGFGGIVKPLPPCAAAVVSSEVFKPSPEEQWTSSYEKFYKEHHGRPASRGKFWPLRYVPAGLPHWKVGSLTAQ